MSQPLDIEKFSLARGASRTLSAALLPDELAAALRAAARSESRPGDWNIVRLGRQHRTGGWWADHSWLSLTSGDLALFLEPDPVEASVHVIFSEHLSPWILGMRSVVDLQRVASINGLPVVVQYNIHGLREPTTLTCNTRAVATSAPGTVVDLPQYEEFVAKAFREVRRRATLRAKTVGTENQRAIALMSERAAECSRDQSIGFTVEPLA